MNKTDPHNAYWLAQLSEPPPVPRLPWDKERPPVCSFIRERVTTRIAGDIWGRSKRMAESVDVSPLAALLAALKSLLYRYSGQGDLVVGTLLNSDSPPSREEFAVLRTHITGKSTVRELLLQETAVVNETKQHLDLPLRSVIQLLDQRSELAGDALFNVALLFEPSRAGETIRSAWLDNSEYLMCCDLVARAREEAGGLALEWDYDAELFEASTIDKLATHYRNLLLGMSTQPDTVLDQLDMLEKTERNQLLVEWNSTETEFPKAACVHHFVESQAKQTPDAVAVICRNHQMTYGELNARANQLASYLFKLGVRPDDVVGICAERSLEMMIGLLGILKAGGAYLPLDPSYPAERLAFMIEDAQIKVLLTQAHLERILPVVPPLRDESAAIDHSPKEIAALSRGAATKTPRRVRLDADWPWIAPEPIENVDYGVNSSNLAYVIYTSGSTGKPKGVMIEHRNVVNFFAGMDACIHHDADSTWLAVTSPSFDISVLELFWTLARGIRVVLYAGDDPRRPSVHFGQPIPKRKMDFSLFYFSSDQRDGPGGAYRLLIEGARFADQNGFVAVWTPERHFHAFGGLFPNPSVTSAALAMVTNHVQIRSGSVVAPLHTPIRIAEEWSVVDNLSKGRVAISFASGWMPEDFTVNPVNYPNRKEIMVQYLDVVRRLWRGEAVAMPGPFGKEVQIKIFPRPVQKELPLWLTAAGNPETFRLAGTLGIHVLTHLLGQSIEEVNKKVAIYRQAWKEAGHKGRGCVTLMLHTFVGESEESVKATVRQPLIEYLRKSADLIKGYAWAWSAFKHQSASKAEFDFSTLPKDELDALLEHSFNRYVETSGLFGTPESCVKIIEKLRDNDIDEVACLIDFGVDCDAVLDNIRHLNALRAATSEPSDSCSGVSSERRDNNYHGDLRRSDETPLQAEPADYSIPALIQRHEVTHLQCTPSMAGMLLLEQRNQSAFGRLRTLLIGGEAFPAALAKQLKQLVHGAIINMYGPTETTIWSSTFQVPAEPARVPVGRPIANTSLYILDQNLLPLPVGIPGELMIGGAGVARGYLGRPGLTAERFIRNPFQNNGARLYRTGDLARYLPDGNIELLGRMDHQVKIRGHRVELGEIEALLNEHPDVRGSVVVAKESATGDQRLVAYVVARDGLKPTRRQLRQYAQERMPEHMVPAEVVFMEAFPHTPNQKIDRKALPALESGSAACDAGFDPPTSDVEKALADLWRHLLGVERIGRSDNFFELGGHSLMAMQLVSRVRDQFDADLPLKNLFEHPTLAGLAEVIEALTWSSNGDKPAPAFAVAEREEVVL